MKVSQCNSPDGKLAWRRSLDYDPRTCIVADVVTGDSPACGGDAGEECFLEEVEFSGFGLFPDDRMLLLNVHPQSGFQVTQTKVKGSGRVARAHTFKAFTKLYDQPHNQFRLSRVLTTAEQIVCERPQ